MEYFHVSNSPLNTGIELRPNYGMTIKNPRFYKHNDHNHAQYLREMIIEEYREKYFPNKPSRLNSIYLFDDIKLAFKYKEKQGKQFVYRVSIDEKAILHKADMSLMDLIVRGSFNEMQDIAHLFYQGKVSGKHFNEILCEGIVKVDGKVGINSTSDLN